MVGIVLADLTIFVIPSLLFIFLIWALDIDSFTNDIGIIFLSFMSFGIGFCSINNLIGFIFLKTEKAFKIATVFIILLGFFPFVTYLVESQTK